MSSEISAVYNSNLEVNDDCLKFTKKIKSAFYNIAREFVYIGFLLAECDYYETYKEWGYNSIHEYASDQLGLKKSSTYNFINVCKAFTNPTECMPCSYFMKDKYENFNYSQLVEMLSMSDKQRSLVSPDMTVKQIKELKKSAVEPEYAKLYNMQLKFIEFDESYSCKKNGKTFKLRVYGAKSLNSNIYPDGYYISVWVSYGSSGHSTPSDRILDYEKFKEYISSFLHFYDEPEDSRRLEAAPEDVAAPEAPEELEPEIVSYPGYDLLITSRGDLEVLFNSIAEAYSSTHKNIDSDLFEMVYGFLKSNDYIICKKVNRKNLNRFAIK